MTTISTQRSKTSSQQSGPINPFARALSEMEKTSTTNKNQWGNLPETLTSNYGQTSGGSLSPDTLNQADLAKKQQEIALKQRRRKELHDRINPVNSKDVFKAKEIRVKKEIERLRSELKALAIEVATFHKEIEVTLMSNVVDPGTEGTYYLNFFQKLRAFIILLRQRVKSARTWATQMNQKKKKKKQGKKPGLEIAGAKSEKTSTVFDMMHHERSNAYGGS